MNAFVLSAIAVLAALIPCGIVVLRGNTLEAVVAYEAIAAIVVLVLVLLAEGFQRSGEFELPLLSAVLAFGGGLVFVRFVERGL